MRRLSILMLLAIAVAVAVAVAATELVLKDGRVIVGIDVRRDGDSYVLTLESGDTIVIPALLVDVVRLTGRPEQARREPDTQQIGTPVPEGPTGLVEAEPEQLGGAEVRPPTTSEQLRALGGRAKFQKDIVDNRWQPSTDWDMDPERQNNFAPSDWSEGVLDPDWQPKSAFDKDEDALTGGRSSWQESIVDNSWTPSDGFSK